MRAVIIGAGIAGRNLAEKLTAEAYDVTVVDHRPEPLRAVEDQLDVMTVQGHGSSPAVLERAEISKADLVVAVTSVDEVNILACGYARTRNVAHRIARVSNPDYSAAEAARCMEMFGVDLLVNPTRECAQEMASLIRLPGAKEVIRMLGNRVLAVSAVLSSDSLLCRTPIKDCPDPELLKNVRFIVVERGRELMIPSGDTQLMVGDDIYAVGEARHMPAFLDMVAPDRPSIRRVIIAGGGMLGLSLANLLDDSGLEVVLVERDTASADACSTALSRTLVLRGDIMNDDTFDEFGVGEHTAFVATTGDDENNIISSLLAQKHGATLTIGKVSKPEYVPVIDSLSLLDRAVSPPLSMLNSILHFVRGRNVRAAMALHTLPGELLEVVLPGDNPWVGVRIKDLQMPPGAIIATVEREGEILVPTGDLALARGDRMVIYALPRTVRKLESIFE